MTNGLPHRYYLDESIFIFRGHRDLFFIFISFFDGNHVSKQNSPRLDSAFCGVTSGAILFAFFPYKGHQAYVLVKTSKSHFLVMGLSQVNV